MFALCSRLDVHYVPHFHNEADEVSSTVPCRSVLIGGIELECITRRFREHLGGQLDGCFLDVFLVVMQLESGGGLSLET